MDTICAIATARAVSAIGVIRVSGDGAFSVCDKIIKLKNGTVADIPQSSLRLGRVYDGDMPVDDVLVAAFHDPHSYSGENLVEINCHGGISILERVIKLLIKNGCRQALGGEFTKRAFLNGKMDLLQAEAVADLIASDSAESAALAIRQMDGRLSREFSDIYDILFDLNTDILAYIDFPDEGLSDVSKDHVESVLFTAFRRLEKLEKSFATGSVIRDGCDTAIVGTPNVGKSTLLNAILGYDRAIVSDIAGTTRDTVTEKATLGGVTLNLCDTAGIREGADVIEKKGIRRSENSIVTSSLVLAVFDGSRELSSDDMRMISLCEKKTAVAVINKSDLPQKIDREYIESRFIRTVFVSAGKNEGISEISDTVRDLFLQDKVQIESGLLLSNTRQYERVCAAITCVGRALEALQSGLTPDVISVDITAAAAELGSITGQMVSDKMIDEIFSKFCVGK